MQIKQFTADSIDDVLAQVRAELGDDAVILQTRRIVRGGIGGFFGREGVEVTAAAGAANREAAASVAAPPSVELTDEDATLPAHVPESQGPAPASEPAFEPLEPFRRHLDGRLAAAEAAEAGEPAPAAPAAAYARAGVPFAPGGVERSRAILNAARAAVREAHEAALAGGDDLLGDLDDGEHGGLEPAGAAAPAPSPAPARGRGRGIAPVAPAAGPLEPLRAELARGGVEARYLDPCLEGFARDVMPFLAPGASVRDALREHIAARLPVVRDWKPRGAGQAIALVGQSGVGKTSAAAALAGVARAAGQRVALIAAGPGAHDVLEAHARRLDVQLFAAEDGEALARVRASLADRDLVVIDTHGRSHQQLAEIEALRALITPAAADEIHLVMPAATPPTDLGDLQRRFRMTGVNRVVLTKLDETRFVGNLVNVPLRIGKPLSFLSSGTSVPGSLAPADGRRVAEALLP